MPIIFALRASWNKGKTDTLRRLTDALQSFPGASTLSYRKSRNPNWPDIHLVVEINGKRIGIETDGDPGSNLKKRLDHLTSAFSCNAIVCATRTRQDTYKAVKDFEKKNGFTVIWSSPYATSDSSLQESLNELKSQHILDLLTEILNLKK